MVTRVQLYSFTPFGFSSALEILMQTLNTSLKTVYTLLLIEMIIINIIRDHHKDITKHDEVASKPVRCSSSLSFEFPRNDMSIIAMVKWTSALYFWAQDWDSHS